MSSLEPSEIQGMVDDAVDSRYKHIDALLHELQRQLVTRWMIAIVGLLVAAGAIYYVAHKASVTANRVQQDRYAAILQNCRDQNHRNEKTIGAFNNFIAIYEKQHPHLTAAQKAQLTTQVRENVALINDLAPHQNCAQLANQQAPTR